MYSNFDKLPKEKKDRIIEVSIKEFANKGYTNASTNSIVKNSDISKGALFNYFKTKKNLYLYIVDYMIDYYLDYMEEKMQYNNPDIFQRILDWEQLKISISTEQPVAYKFFASVFINSAEELKNEIEIRYKKLYEYGYKLAFEDVDLSKFRDDIDKQKTLEIIAILLDGILGNSITAYKSLSDYGYESRTQAFEKIEEYITVLRKVFYKDI